MEDICILKEIVKNIEDGEFVEVLFKDGDTLLFFYNYDNQCIEHVNEEKEIYSWEHECSLQKKDILEFFQNNPIESAKVVLRMDLYYIMDAYKNKQKESMCREYMKTKKLPKILGGLAYYPGV